MQKRQYLTSSSLVIAVLIFIVPFVGQAEENAASTLKINPERFLGRIDTLAEFGASEEGGVNRVEVNP